LAVHGVASNADGSRAKTASVQLEVTELQCR
jgi:hypothetical protein